MFPWARTVAALGRAGLLGGLLLLAPAGRAQAPLPGQAPPRIGYVYPAGGQQGSVFTVTVGGQFLSEGTEAVFTGPGLRTKFLGYQRPLNQKEMETLKEEAEKLQAKRRASRQSGGPEWTPADEARIKELQEKRGYRMNAQKAPAICEAVTYEVTVAPDAAPGAREIRLRNDKGLSSPLVFWIGRLPEVSEPAASANTAPTEGRDPTAPRRPRANPERRVALPAIVNGQILPGEADRIRFSATKGQRLVIAASARALIPYLADAVPGWFQATLALFDSQGRQLAYDDDFQFNPDPVLFYEVRADGDYVIEIKDSIYRGRQDFVYRLVVSEQPFITSLFPLGGRAGMKTEVEVNGWNLPSPRSVLDAKDRKPGVLELSVQKDGLLSNSASFALGADPEVAAAEPNDDPAHAQAVTLPVVVNGRIERPGDRDVFSFQGRAGAEVVIEAYARRLNSPLDSILKLTDETGTPIATNDDSEDKGAGLTTHHADSRIAAKLPADGRYFIELGDTQHQGGSAFGYRLHIGPPRPDFELRVTPSSLNLRPGMHVPVTVFALRKDGFAGEIQLGLRDDSHAFGLGGARIPAGQDKVRITLATSNPPREEPYRLRIAGRATIGGKPVEHDAVPAEDMMQAFAYRHLVPAQAQWVQVIAGGAQRWGGGRRIGGEGRLGPIRLVDSGPVRIPAGGSARFRVAVETGPGFETIRLELSEPPDGIAMKPVAKAPGVIEVVVTADAAVAKPGLRGNLILNVVGERVTVTEAKADKPKAQNRNRIGLGVCPAMAFEVIAQ